MSYYLTKVVRKCFTTDCQEKLTDFLLSPARALFRGKYYEVIPGVPRIASDPVDLSGPILIEKKYRFISRILSAILIPLTFLGWCIGCLILRYIGSKTHKIASLATYDLKDHFGLSLVKKVINNHALRKRVHLDEKLDCDAAKELLSYINTLDELEFFLDNVDKPFFQTAEFAASFFRLLNNPDNDLHIQSFIKKIDLETVRSLKDKEGHTIENYIKENSKSDKD
jgi:hypothetical protein